MKATLITLLLLGFVACIKSQSPADTTDPFFGHHSLGSSSELLLQFTPKGSSQNRVVYDFNNNLPEEKFRDLSHTNGGGGYRANDVVTGDFTGDYVDDVISAWQSTNNTWTNYYPLTLSIPKIDSTSMSWSQQYDTIIATDCGNQIRLISGNFDYDDPKEFVLVYTTTYGNIRVILFEIDDTFKLYELSRTTLDKNYDVWDICADDFDGDGLDEFMFFNPYNVHFVSDDSCIINSKVSIYNFYKDSGFELFSSNTIQTNNTNALTYATYNPYKVMVLPYSSGGSCYINSVGIATGNVDDDNGMEIVYCYEISLPITISNYCYKIYRLSYFDVPEISYSQPILTPRSLSASANMLSKRFYEEDPGYYGHSSDVQAIDLDMDSKDEIFTFCNGRVQGCRMNPIEWFFMDEVWSIYPSYNSHNLLRVSDLDADPTDMNSLAPEIVAFNIYDEQAVTTIYKLNVDSASHTIEENMDARTRIPTGLNQNNLYSAALALGDFNGDGIYLGKPKLLVKKSVFVPTVIINAPPSHFDILQGTKYDVNFFYSPWSPSSPKPTTSTTYKETAEETITCTSELKRDWKVSSEFKTGTEFIGVKYKASLSASYGEKLSRKNTTTKTIAISKTAIADRDDFLFGMKVDYHLFEYPIMHKGKSYGNILFSTPVLREEIGDFSKNLSYDTYSLKHEVNNLLSYPYCRQISDNSDVLFGAGNGSIFGTKFGLSDVLNPNDWKLDVSKLRSANVTETNEFNLGMKVSASAWGCSIGLEGKYGNEGVTSHETILKEGFSVLSNFDRINRSLGEVEYSLQPYVYWSENGALVIDYNVNPTGMWWRDNYGEKPDLAFIMPYRYGPEKNQALARDSKRILTSDIKYFPYDAKPDESITIMATIRNFCLNNTVESASVNFYLGDPDDGGELIESTTVENIVPRGSSTVRFNWKTPAKIPDKPWIFAVIDRDSLVSEIHENNNKGFTFLFINDTFPKSTVAVGIEDLPKPDEFESSVFPNPAKDYAILSFYQKDNLPVDFAIYNSLGQKIDQQRFIYKNPGPQSETIRLSSFAPGLYLYEIASGKSRSTGRLLVE